MLERSAKLQQRFNPNHDPATGEFAEGGGGGGGGGESKPASDSDHAKGVMSVARDVAKDMGFNADDIVIGEAGAPEQSFTLNGQQYRAAGLAYIHHGPLEGKIKLFPDQIPSVQAAEGVMAHEIEHHKFQMAMDRYRVEMQLINAEPAKDVMNSDGSLKPPYDTKYKAYTAMHDALFKYNTDAFADADGVSDYSYEYWKGWKGGTVQTDYALHETLAEMARIKYQTGKFPEHMGERIISYRGDKPKPSQKVIEDNAKRWRNLYRTVEKLW